MREREGERECEEEEDFKVEDKTMNVMLCDKDEWGVVLFIGGGVDIRIDVTLPFSITFLGPRGFYTLQTTTANLESNSYIIKSWIKY